MSHCGHSKNKERVCEYKSLSTSTFLPVTACTRTLYTAYVGNVEVDCATNSDKKIALQSTVIDPCTGQSIEVRVINAKEHNLFENITYSPDYLKQLPPMTVDEEDNKYYYVVILMASLGIAKLKGCEKDVEKITRKLSVFSAPDSLISRAKSQYPQIFQTNASVIKLKQVYREAVKHNSAVDILFNIVNYVQFLKQEINLWGINHKPYFLAIANIDNLDNAYWTGEYMVFGNGANSFYPLTSLDVCGHEIGHGVVAQLSGLKYEKHSGALNESFADIIGTHFEMYMYEKFAGNSDTRDDLLGEGDYLIGEDLDMSGKCLRSMMHPEAGLTPQPSRFKGLHYFDPSQSADYGGVHINSGIPNHCFYLLSQKIGRVGAFKKFLDCLRKLNPKSSFIDFRNVLLQVSGDDKNVKQCLDQVGLDCNAVSDMSRPWTPGPNQKRKKL